MHPLQRSTRILLTAVVVIALVAVVSSSTVMAYVQPEPAPQGLDIRQHAGPTGAEDWISTPAAQVRNSLGECPANFECLELCIAGEGTGNFQCWPQNSW